MGGTSWFFVVEAFLRWEFWKLRVSDNIVIKTASIRRYIFFVHTNLIFCKILNLNKNLMISLVENDLLTQFVVRFIRKNQFKMSGLQLLKIGVLDRIKSESVFVLFNFRTFFLQSHLEESICLRLLIWGEPLYWTKISNHWNMYCKLLRTNNFFYYLMILL